MPDKYKMILPFGETFKLETIEDIVNCPVNMHKEVLDGITTAWIKRLEKIDETGKDHVISKVTLSVTNDGIDKTYTDIRVNGKPEKETV